MDENDFEGSLVLEQLATINMVDDFFEAIDSDDIKRVVIILKKAKIDASTIAVIIRKIEDGEN